MIAVIVLAGLFIAVGVCAGYFLYLVTGYEDDLCDSCGRAASGDERESWIEYRGDIFCSGDCFRGRDA